MSAPYRLTVVLEYPSVDAAPCIGPGTTDFGPGRVVALQFSDALAELAFLYGHADDKERLIARQRGRRLSANEEGNAK